jgi:hypothetical protein
MAAGSPQPSPPAGGVPKYVPGTVEPSISGEAQYSLTTTASAGRTCASAALRKALVIGPSVVVSSSRTRARASRQPLTLAASRSALVGSTVRSASAAISAVSNAVVSAVIVRSVRCVRIG